ncbi:MAG: hypothetical protein AUJ08_06115 [Thaumarchaeota archaeon 13_1_40CM_3_50_5]|nr:MAG: hypothetical protein AUJ08_06115 [Thaumarchaeota archaeon 13_1_40CM_3_50_5]
MSSEENIGRIRSAASLLVKGGTLTSEPCTMCGGVQVRFADKTTCINCGNESEARAKQKTESQKAVPAQSSASLASAALLIEEKIGLLAAEIKSENDISVQRQKADLLESYLKILEKTKSLLG